MKIRYAKYSDLDFLVKGLEETRIIEKRQKTNIKEARSYRNTFKDATKKKNIIVIEENKKPIAFIYFKTDHKVAYVKDRALWIGLIFVDQTYRRKSLGKKLYEETTKIAKKRKCKKIILEIFDANTKSKEFHENLNFKPVYSVYEKNIS